MAEEFATAVTPQPCGPAKAPTSANLVRRVKKLGAASALLLLVVVLLWSFRQPLLQGFMEAWAVDEPLQKADAIVVLGGGLDVRPFAAAELYKQGYAPQVLVAIPPVKRAESMGLVQSHGAHNRAVLLHEGVPETAIVSLGTDLKNTCQEALALREWLKTSQVKRIIIPTEAMHTRRVRWLFDKILADQGVEIIVTRLESPEYNASNWWMSETGLIAVQNEVMKYFYYRLKY